MIKRLTDIIVSSIALILLIPLIIVVILLIHFDLGRPYLLVQLRPGLDSKPFKFVKFRSMNNLKDNEGNLLPDKYRLTKMGKFLRKTSLDEIPSLWNVLMGQMSLVGPRPLLMEYLDLYTAEQISRNNVKPGITGWAQINGRNNITWEEKFDLDIWYINNQSFWLDIKILCITLPKVFQKDGISYSNQATMHKFEGSNE